MFSARPKVSELVFQLYGRALHPELFEIHASRTVDRGQYAAEILITRAGHIVSWRSKPAGRGSAVAITLTEVATAASQPLPQKRRLISHPIRGERNDRMETPSGICYEMGVQLEQVDPEVFWTFQQELSADGITHGLFHRFEPAGRLAVGPMSWVNVETRARSLLIQAFHTFPEDFAIVKSQSCFELP